MVRGSREWKFGLGLFLTDFSLGGGDLISDVVLGQTIEEKDI